LEGQALTPGFRSRALYFAAIIVLQGVWKSKWAVTTIGTLGNLSY
jgi:hypothetical protein